MFMMPRAQPLLWADRSECPRGGVGFGL